MNLDSDECCYYYDPELIAIALALAKQDGWNWTDEAYSVITSPNVRPMYYWRMALVAIETMNEFRKSKKESSSF